MSVCKCDNFDEATRLITILGHAIKGRDAEWAVRVLHKISELNLNGLDYLQLILEKRKKDLEALIIMENESNE